MIRALYVEPQKMPKVVEFENTLENHQGYVGGTIQAIYPFDDNVALVLDDEGKLKGKPFNRGLADEDGNLYDIIVGSFLVVGLGEEDFASLTDEQIEKYSEMYQYLEYFVNGVWLRI